MVGRQVPWPRPASAGRLVLFILMYLYILKSEKFNRHYVGISKAAFKRVAEHNSGKVKSTKKYKPWIIIHTEFHSDYKSAREREKYLKSYKGVREKRKIIYESEKK